MESSVNMSFPQRLTMQQTVVVESNKAPQVNFLLQTCAHCHMEVLLSAGDVLHGEEWYHGHCWDGLQGDSSGLSKAG
jgi:hypothetical protein